MDRKESFFEKNPLKTMIIFIIILLLILEFFLRIINPGIMDFVHQARQVHSYSSKWYVDLEPDRAAHLCLRSSDNENLFNFIITTGKYGFRTYDREIDNNYELKSKGKIIHAIGDSYTMGWGVDFTSSYPAILDWMLPGNYRVLNLGVDGYGTVASTEKSVLLWSKFPADHVVYLFCSNDFEDDEKAIRTRHRSVIYHITFKIIDFFRKNTYVANIPFGLRWYIYFKNEIKSDIYSDSKVISVKEAETESLIKKYTLPKSQEFDEKSPTLSHIKAYSDFVRKHNAKLSVFVLTGPGDKRSLDFYAYCLKNNIDTYLIEFPKKMKLVREGHLNYLGNYSLAKLVKDKVFSKL
ncbi:MAG: SGNH/GDSL hydrolase family protein [Elusimicrobia bacterium]|nr:SGNH/GDSL hydrolase family protein [Elusimicrobiota bacterium]